jgi:hypothetical protein
MTTALVAQTLPAKVVRVSGTTLFHVAARELGDATLWERIADLNGLTDPWITRLVELKIPPRASAVRLT